MNVAAFVNSADEVVDFFVDGRLSIFEKGEDRWVSRKSVPLALQSTMSLSQMKVTLKDAVSQLEGCQVFLLHDLRGIMRVFLEEQGFRVWKSEGTMQEQLESVLLQELANLVQIQIEDPVPSPLPDGSQEDACYRIDLIELIQSGSPHVSREVLLPFFETTSFQKLEIHCDHIPRWFKMELPSLGLHVDSQIPDSTGNGMTVTVKPKSGTRSSPPGRRSKSFGCSCGG